MQELYVCIIDKNAKIGKNVVIANTDVYVVLITSFVDFKTFPLSNIGLFYLSVARCGRRRYARGRFLYKISHCRCGEERHH